MYTKFFKCTLSFFYVYEFGRFCVLKFIYVYMKFICASAFIFDINPLSPGDKRAKGVKRRLRTFDVQIKNLMSAFGKMIEPL